MNKIIFKVLSRLLRTVFHAKVNKTWRSQVTEVFINIRPFQAV